MKAAKHLATSVIWHICGQFVNNDFIDWGAIVFDLLASLSSSDYTLPFVSGQGYTFWWNHCFFLQICEEVLGMFCGVCTQTHHQTWLQLFTTSPLPMLLLTFLVTWTTTYWYWSPVHKLQRNNSYIRNKESFTFALAAKMYVGQFSYSERPPLYTSTGTYQ